MDLLTNLIVANISQYIHEANLHIIYLKVTQHNMSIIPQ